MVPALVSAFLKFRSTSFLRLIFYLQPQTYGFSTISKNQRSIESLCWKGLWWAHQMKDLGLFTGDVLD
mgnify:FL=1